MLNEMLTKILEQEYIIWDRKFGDPQLLTHDRPQASSKYDGKLSGSWTFPFSIPFPSCADSNTLCAIYPKKSEGPVRFLPERLREGSSLTPFDLSGGPTGIQSLDSAPFGASNLAPFDIRTPHTLTEKGRLVLSSQTEMPAQVSPSHFAPITASSAIAPSTPSIEPYVQRQSEGSNASEKPGHLPPNHALATNGHRRRRGATSMQDPEHPTFAAAQSLPQSFSERAVMASVQYELTLTITHGIFSTKSR